MDENISKKEDGLVSPPKESVSNEPEIIRPIRTLEDDIAEAVREGKGSILGVALAEQKRKDGSTQYILEKKSSNIYMVLGTIFILASVGLGGYFLYQRYTVAKEFVGSTQGLSYIHPFLQSDKTDQIDLSEILPKNGITKSFLYSIGGSDLSSNTLRIILPVLSGSTPTLATLKDILPRLAPNMPDSLKRTLGADYAFGIYSGDIAAPFIVLKTNSYENAFAGMLSWENYIPDDLFTFMGIIPSTNSAPIVVKPPRTVAVEISTSSSTTTSTTTPAVTEVPVINTPAPDDIDITKFVDRTIKNKDVRVLQDRNGKIFFIYGFSDSRTIIITTSPESYFEIIDKLK